MIKSIVTKKVIELFEQQEAKGQSKYGVLMEEDTDDMLYWIDHAIEEAADLLNYLMRIKYTLEKRPPSKAEKSEGG